MKFRKKPYAADALQWTGRNEDEMRCYLGYESNSRSPIAKDRPFSVYTPTGSKEVQVGDWVIKGFFNELEVVAPALFKALYEPVEGGNKMSEKNGYKEACLSGGMLKAKTEEGGPDMGSKKYHRMKTKGLIRWCGYNSEDVLQFLSTDIERTDLKCFSWLNPVVVKGVEQGEEMLIENLNGDKFLVTIGDYIHRTENGALWVERGHTKSAPIQGEPGTQEPMKDSESISDKTLDPFKMLLDSVRNSNDSLTASEALYGFAAWLTKRKEKVTLSSSDDAAVVADLVNAFIKANSLSEPRKSWTYVEPTAGKEVLDAITALREYVKNMKDEDSEKADTSDSDVYHEPHGDGEIAYGKKLLGISTPLDEGIYAKQYFKTIDDILADKKAPEGTVKNPCPLDIGLIPNTMGINLCSVKGVEWVRQDDNQLVAVCIHFKPDNTKKSEEVDGKKAFVDVLQSATEVAKVDHEKAYAFLKFFVKTVEGEQTEGPLSREAFLGCILELAEALSPSPKE